MNDDNIKCHVMHVVNSLDVGGMENGVVNIANLIDKDKFRYSVCCLSHPGGLSNRIQDDNISIIHLGWSGGFHPQIIFQLAKLFKKQKVDIVHTHGWQTLIYSSCASILSGFPVLINGEHGTFFLDKIRRRVAYRIISKIVDRYITVSYSLEKELACILDNSKAKIVTIPNGVDLKKFSSVRNDNARLFKSKLAILNGSLVIGTLGRLVPVKNIEMLLQVFACIYKDFPNVDCVLIGDGYLKKDLEDLAVQLGIVEKVHFVGRVENPHEWMSVIDLFVSTSNIEGTSNAILEAMACGKPIVATDVGDNCKLLEVGGNGFMVPSGDHLALEKVIRQLLPDEEVRNKFGLRSRAIVEEKYDISKMVLCYEKIYLQSVACKRGHNATY